MPDLSGKVALVTGASRGIGKEVALRLAGHGAAVFLVAEGTEEELRTVAESCAQRSGGKRVGWRAIDLAGAGAAEKMVADCLAELGRVDILINNAGVRCRKAFGDFTQEDYEWVQGVNLRTPFFACQATLPTMRAQGGGRIVNIGSQFGSAAFEDHALYGMTKAAIIYLTRAIAFECASSGIVVNCVSPGPTDTDYMIARLADKPELRRKMEGYVPLGRFGKTEEVAEAVVFLATSEGTAIQGHDLLVDGGWLTH
jgi:NAD(P)-dependent dehydrogenase (short-subunit alcohol dehydrogenase family)